MQPQDFNQSWQFFLGEPHHETWNWPKDSSWRELNLPHDWSIELPRKPDHISGKPGGFGEMGRGWYRKYFTAPADWAGKKVFLEFEGVYMNAEVSLNDHLILRHPYGYTSFLADLTPFLRIGGENLLRVRVDNSHQLNSRWYSGSGIYRPVWLMVAEAIRLQPWGVQVTTPQVSREAAEVAVKWLAVNDEESAAQVEVRGKVLDANGAQVAEMRGGLNLPAHGEGIASATAAIASPRLWSPDHPNLYRLVSEVYRDSVLCDRSETIFGVRSLAFSAEKGFLLNGEPIKLKGGCVHHDNGILGSASHPRAEERKVELHKASGFNAIRTAHNPPAPAFLEACDRLGMLVMNEAFDCWREGKNIGDYHVVFEDWWERDIEAMVMRDFNHPCIFAWSIGNEVLERDKPEGAVIARQLAAKVRALDPTRPVISAICGSWDGQKWEETDATFAALDIGGYNYQWKQYESDHSRFSRRMMIGTESFPIEAWENWDQVERNPYVLGDFVWTSLDYIGESGIGRTFYADEAFEFLGEYPWHTANCGDLDLTGFKRPQSWYRDILWKEDAAQTIFVHEPLPEGRERKVTQWGWPLVWNSWNWEGHEGTTFKVDVYTPCDEVELLLNGVSLGVRKAEKHIASFEVAYQPGELTAIGRGGRAGSRTTALCTCGPATGLRLSVDRAQVPAGGLVYAAVEIIDDQGRLRPGADRQIRFNLSGAGRILAVGSADPLSEELYVGDARTTFNGRALVVIQPAAAGDLVLRAEAEGLQAAEVAFSCV